MALAIDSTILAKSGNCWVRVNPRYLVYRVCAHATVINDTSLAKRVRCASKEDLASGEALDWQADQDEDHDDAEVIYHLQQQAKSSPVFGNAISRTERSDAVTTLVTSCSLQSPSILARARGRPLSSFRRLSYRQSMFAKRADKCCGSESNLGKVFSDAPPWIPFWMTGSLKISGESFSEYENCVVWQVQLDIVDLLSPRRLPTWLPGKRRRTTINSFHQVPAPPEQDASPRNHPPEAKRFKGVRYRRERRTWAAEMKPPRYRNKVSFGEFKSQSQAARAIDAAFHYYGKPHLLNFPDTPGILSSRPSPAEVLDEEDKLSFVKEQVKWLASMASTLPSSSPLVAPEIPESSSRGRIGDTFKFRTFSEITSSLGCGVTDESDDGTSRPLCWLLVDAMAELASCIDSMEPSSAAADVAGGIMGSSDEHQGILEGNSEDALVAPSSSGRWSLGSSVQVTHLWDSADVSGTPTLMNSTNSAEPSCESQGSWMNYLR